MMSLWGELKTRGVFKVAAAYLFASWLIVQVVSVLTEPLSLPDTLDTVVVVLLAIGFPFALIIAWIYDITPDGIQVTAEDGRAPASMPGQRLTYVIVILFVLAIGLMTVNRFLLTPSSGAFGAGSRLAILPCTDFSPDPSNAFFAAGIYQELIRQLGSLSGLEVIGPSSVQQYAGRQVPASQIARDQSVQAVMECSALYSGEQVRLTTLLLDGATDVTLWSSVYPADMSNLTEIFQIQEDIATQVTSAMRVEFLDDERLEISQPPTQSRRAYELYLEGLALPQLANVAGVIDLMSQAIDLDPAFVEAWSAKSEALSRGFVGQPETERMEMLADALQAANRAIELAPNQGPGYRARAQVRGIQHDWLGAERDHRAAIERGGWSISYGVFLLSVGDFESARAAFERVLETDPRNPDAHAFLSLAHELLRDSEAANTIYRRAKQLFPVTWFGNIAWSWVHLGRADGDSDYELSRLPDLGQLLELTANDDRLAQLSRMASANPRPALLSHYAVWAASFGDPDYALSLLEEAVSETGSGLLMYMAWFPVFDEARQLDRFRDLLRQTGLVDYWQTRGWPDFCRPLTDNDEFVCS